MSKRNWQGSRSRDGADALLPRQHRGSFRPGGGGAGVRGREQNRLSWHRRCIRIGDSRPVSPVTPQEREQIIEALKAGGSIHGVAKTCGRAKGTVSAIAHSAGIERSAPEKAVAARVDYCAAERLVLLNEGFAKAREILETVRTPNGLQSWTIAVGILTDKRRLEDGDATSRSEVIGVSDTRSRLASRLDELAARRAAKATAERAVG